MDGTRYLPIFRAKNGKLRHDLVFKPGRFDHQLLNCYRDGAFDEPEAAGYRNVYGPRAFSAQNSARVFARGPTLKFHRHTRRNVPWNRDLFNSRLVSDGIASG